MKENGRGFQAFMSRYPVGRQLVCQWFEKQSGDGGAKPPGQG